MPPPYQNATYTAVRGLSRGLSVLSALNTAARGQATASELAEATGLHRTTVRRLLETLADDGYVHRSATDDYFRITKKVQELSDGYQIFDRISSIAMPIMGDLLKRVVWPSSLSLPDVEAMYVGESTHRFSRLSFHRSMAGRRIPFLLTASGRAYFAYCDAQEQEEILSILRHKDDIEGRLANDAKYVANMIRTTQERGFGSNSGEWEAERKVGAIAMPVMEDHRPIGSLNIVYLTHVVPVRQAEKKYAEPLREAVQEIERHLKGDVNMSGAYARDNELPCNVANPAIHSGIGL